MPIHPVAADLSAHSPRPWLQGYPRTAHQTPRMRYKSRSKPSTQRREGILYLAGEISGRGHRGPNSSVGATRFCVVHKSAATGPTAVAVGAGAHSGRALMPGLGDVILGGLIRSLFDGSSVPTL